MSRKKNYAIILQLQSMVVKRTTMEKQMRFFFTMFSTSVYDEGHVNRINLQSISEFMMKDVIPQFWSTYCIGKSNT